MGLLDLLLGRFPWKSPDERPLGSLSAVAGDEIASPNPPTSPDGANEPLLREEDITDDMVARFLFQSLLEYGVHNDENSVAALRQLYAASVPRISEQQRMQMLVELIGLAEQGKISANPLNAFLFVDPSISIVSTTALHLAAIYPGTTEADPLFGVRQLLGFANQHASDGDEHVAVSILMGLLLIGDRRVTEELRNCWRMLSAEGRATLSHMEGVRLYATVIDWLIDWLEDCEGDEFGAVAAALVRSSQVAKAEGVIETRRALPLWSQSEDQIVTTVAEWTFAEFGARIRPRLQAIAERESEPRIMPDVLAAWEIGGLQEVPQVFLGRSAHRDAGLPLRDLLSIIPQEATENSKWIGSIAVSDDELLDQGGHWLVVWGIFNPFGPTLSSWSAAYTKRNDISLLVYRMLNPFRQDSIVVATLVGSSEEKELAARSCIEQSFRRNLLSAPDSETLYPVTSVQSFVFSIWDRNDADQLVRNAFIGSPGLLGDVYLPRWLEFEEAHRSDPWALAGEQRDEGLRALEAAQKGVSHEIPQLLPLERRIDIARQWWDRITTSEHWVPQLVQFPNAWSGAIEFHRRNGGELDVYPFERVDAFMETYQFPYFRTIREQAEAAAR